MEQNKFENCKFCKSEIDPDAILCKHCGKFQNWRAYLPFSNTIISLLIALISITALTIPVFMEAFHKPNSKMTFQIISRGEAYNNFLVLTSIITNIGDKPGNLGPARFKMFIDNERVASGRAEVIKLEKDIIFPNDYLKVLIYDYLETLESPDFKLSELANDERIINKSIRVEIEFDFYDFYRNIQTVKSSYTFDQLYIN